MPPDSHRLRIEAQLQRILAGKTFARAPRLRQLLRFLVSESLNGRGTDLKETLIGVEVFRKDAGYDPTRDAVVRTTATRLREKLRLYYATEGRSDPWRIEIAPDGYIPQITPGNGEAPPPVPVPSGATEAGIANSTSEPLSVEISPPTPEPRRSLRLTWRYAALVSGMLVASAGVISAVFSHPGQPYVSAYHQLTWDGKGKSGPLFSDGEYVYFWENVTFGDRVDRRLAFVPVSGNGEVQLQSLPGPAPSLVDIASDGEFLIRPDARQPSGPYYLWSRRSGELKPTRAVGTVDAAISPDRRWIADAHSNQIVISDLVSNAADRIVRVSNAVHYPRWSPDGRRLRFVAQNWRNSVWECNHDGSGLRLVIDQSDGLIADPNWTLDGQLYVYQRSTESKSDVWARPERVTLLRRSPVPLAQGPLDLMYPRPSPNSERLFAISRNLKGELVRFDRNTHVSTPFLAGISAMDLNFSRDGRWVAYQQFPKHTLWRRRIDGTEALQLTPAGLEVFQPHWSPDGKRIGFMGHKSGGLYRIYIVGVDGRGLKELKPDDDFDQGVPSWSGDGTRIVFGELRIRKPESEMAIHLIDIATNTESVIPNSKGKWTPRWSPDGQYIVAQSPDFKSLFLYDVKGGLWRTLVQGLRSIDCPTWSTDSKFVYFSYVTEGTHPQAVIGRIGLDADTAEILAWEASMPPRLYAWFTLTPENDLLLLRAVRIEEIYALDLAWR